MATTLSDTMRFVGGGNTSGDRGALIDPFTSIGAFSADTAGAAVAARANDRAATRVSYLHSGGGCLWR